MLQSDQLPSHGTRRVLEQLVGDLELIVRPHAIQGAPIVRPDRGRADRGQRGDESENDGFRHAAVIDVLVPLFKSQWSWVTTM